MNREELLEISQKLFTDDVLELKKMKSRLKEILCADNVLAVLDSTEKESIVDLLHQIISNESTEINEIVCESMTSLLEDEIAGPRLLEVDSEFVIPSFVFTAFGSDNLSLSMGARKACIAVLRLCGERNGISELFLAHVLNDNCLRLIDCDHLNSQLNRVAIEFILGNPSVLHFATQRTLECFSNDPLLLPNYLIFIGILSRFDCNVLSGELKEQITNSLADLDDELQWMAVSQCCYYAMLDCDQNSSTFGVDWVRAAIKILKSTAVSEEMIVFSVKLISSAATTPHGWEAAASHLPTLDICSLLKSRKSSTVCSALYLLQSMFQSAHFDREKLPSLDDCAHEAWKHRNSLEEDVREALWGAIYAMNSKSSFPITNACISFLCAPSREESNKNVRKKQVLVAQSLLQLAGLPAVSSRGLEQFVKKGLYPPGSSGVPAMLAQ